MKMFNYFSSIKNRLTFQVAAQIASAILLVILLIFSSINLLNIKETSQISYEESLISSNIHKFLSQKITVNELLASIKKIEGQSEQKDNLIKIKHLIIHIDSINNENIQIDVNIQDLTKNSIKQSNTYIKKTTERLIKSNEKDSVSDIERLVLIGASQNTNLNYKIYELFLKLQQNPLLKDSLFLFIDKAINNAVKDKKQLKGSTFESLPRKAINSNKKIKKYIITYINNVNLLTDFENKLQAQESKFTKNTSTSISNRISKMSSNFRIFYIYIIIFMLLISSFSVIFSYSIAKELNHFISIASSTYEEIEKGVFITSKLDKFAIKKNELAKLSKKLSGTVQNLKQVIQLSDKNTKKFYVSAQEITNSAENLSKNTAQEATSMEETSAAIEQMTANLEAMAQNSIALKNRANETNSQIKIVSKVVEKSSQSLNQTIKKSLIIKEISRKVDILAINAAIEAARAGTSGLGFSVIAEEIRKLADLTQQSASQIEEIASKGEKDAKNSSLLANRIVPVIDNMLEGIVDLADSVEEIKSGAGQISSSTTQLNNATQENAQLAEELSQTAETLNIMIEDLDFGKKLFKKTDISTDDSLEQNISEENSLTETNLEEIKEEEIKNEIEEELEKTKDIEEINNISIDLSNNKTDKDEDFEAF